MPKQCTIVLVSFPFTDLSAAKVRPAVVLSVKPTGSDVILAFISSKRKQGEYDIGITPSTLNGLKAPSIIVCSKLATLEKAILLGEIGFVEKGVMAHVKSKLRAI